MTTRTNSRHALTLFVLGVVWFPHEVANSQTPDKDGQQIEIRISPKAKVIRVGDAVELRVEIWNVGQKELFIEKEFYRPCSYSPLSLQLDLGPPLKTGPGVGCASDCGDDREVTFANRLVQRWIPLPVGHFYGTVVHMGPGHFPQLETPGRWRLHGRYESSGDMSSAHCPFPALSDPFPGLWDHHEQIENLPYKPWHGEEDTNIVWIEVRARRN